MVTIDTLAAFCKRKGFVYPSSELYGGLAGLYDYGPYGVDLKRNIMNAWWKSFVQDRADVVGLDGTIISSAKIWEASGHLKSFSDPVLTCEKCKTKVRADTFIEEKTGLSCDGKKIPELNALVREHKLVCPSCKGSFKEIHDFNLMFPVQLGVDKDAANVAYLRGETAQLIFADFKLIVDNARLQVPFGIAQMGKAFRNEISPRNFLFRLREFEQMELEYFVHPNGVNDCLYFSEVASHELLVYSATMQQTGKASQRMTLQQAVDSKIISTIWHAYWLGKAHQWFISLGANPAKFRIRQHLPTEKSHYALDTWDLEYEFPFGWKELEGMANRTDYDLRQHMQHSGKDLSLFDQTSGKKFIPHVVAEPSLGVDRTFLVFLFDAYEESKEREYVVLHLHPRLAPIKVAIFPLVNKLYDATFALYSSLQQEFVATFDSSGSIGRRYARADELGIPFCVTFDFDSLEKKDVTIRDRDSAQQVRVPLSELSVTIHRLLTGMPFSSLVR